LTQANKFRNSDLRKLSNTKTEQTLTFQVHTKTRFQSSHRLWDIAGWQKHCLKSASHLPTKYRWIWCWRMVL